MVKERSPSEVVEITQCLSHTEKKLAKQGLTSLVGVGPGDPDLLTVKALRLIQTADIILYDRLVSPEICALFPNNTTTIYVGKAKGKHSVSQDKLNELMLAKAKQGLHICRLKGGDPFVFGRGSEEALYLKEFGVNVELVPGVTAASACSSYAGIPLTHRGVSQGCTFLTAHAETELKLNWQALASLNHTLVFYMGLSKANLIQSQLINNGLTPPTPVAFIERGCCPEQRVVITSLEKMLSVVDSEEIQSPALIVIGETVKFSNQLQWFSGLADSELQQLSA